MLLNSDQINLIKNNKVCYINNFTELNQKYDFNLISSLIEENYLNVIPKTNFGNLQDIFQITRASDFLNEFKIFLDFFRKMFNYEFNKKDEVDLYFSFVSQIGVSHQDIEDVFILGLAGRTMYKIFDTENKDYEIKKGDLIFIPKNLKHKAIGTSPRIIASIGFYGKRLK